MSLTPEQRKSLKQEYGRLYEALTELLAEEDLMGLVRLGAPRDEYELEVDVILQRLSEARSPRVLGSIIYETFVQCFGTAFASRHRQSSEHKSFRFVVIGERAWALWKRWEGEAQQK